MNLQKEKQKIEKALRVIELIEHSEKWIKYHKHDLEIYPSMRTHYQERITIMQAVKARLENYYKNLIK